MPTLGELGEEALLSWLKETMQWESKEVLLGPGDDAAVLSPFSHPLLATVDNFVEGVHFRPSWMSWEDVGWKALVVSLSDIAAMGGTPKAALVSLAAPPDMDFTHFSALAKGLKQAAEAFQCPIVGGNLTRAKEVVLTTTVLGEAPSFQKRKKGRRGECIWVTGYLGTARAALLALEQGESFPFVEEYKRPVPRLLESQFLCQFPITSLMDLSDGLSRDLPRLVPGASVDLTKLPIRQEVAAFFRRLGQSPFVEAAKGGEDYELLGTIREELFPILKKSFEESFSLPLTLIGRVEDKGFHWLLEGEKLTLSGFDHFKR